MVTLPGALTSFSQSALRNIEALEAIQKSIPNPQSVVSSNVTKAANGTVAADPLFSNVSSFTEAAAQRFLDSITSPASFSPTLQQSSYSSLFGTGRTTGESVTGFLDTNVRLEDIIPAHQLYQTLNGLGVSSMYADPLQAYAQVTTASRDLTNICQEAEAIIVSLQADLANLLTIQTGINYAAVPSMNLTFFATAKTKAVAMSAALTVVNTTFTTRGRYDAAEVSAFCALLDDLVNFLSFANTKTLQFDELRKTINERLQRLILLGRQMVQILSDIVGYVPAYVASTLFGKVFQSLQRKVLDQSGVDIGRILEDLAALAQVSTSDKARVEASFDIIGNLEAIKAYICNLDPSTDVVDPGGEFAPLKTGYDALTAGLVANDPSSLFAQLEARVAVFLPTANTGVTRDNSSELSTEVALLGAILTPLALFLTNTCAVADTFIELFGTETAGQQDRVAGVNELFNSAGLTAARDTALTNRFEDFATTSLSEATKPGELAEAIAQQAAQLPDGYEKDQLTNLHAKVYARHRATVVSMDFQRREEAATFISLDREEQDRKLAAQVIKTFSGLNPDEFDSVETFF